MKREPVHSSSLKEVGYDPATRTLEILFTSGGIYSYADCPPEVYQTLMRVDSKGKYFISRIKEVFACTTLFKPEKKEKPDGKTNEAQGQTGNAPSKRKPKRKRQSNSDTAIV